jgi:hemoglobin/transferrin/lactoferrin receptor protein
MGYSISRALLRASASTLAIVFLQAAPGFAPAADAQTIGLDTVEVTSTKTEEKAIDSLAAVSTVRTEQMNAVQPNRISEMFFDVPGIWFSQELGTDPAATAINIRGLQDFGRVAVIVDGARQNYQRSAHQANGTFYLDPELLAGADVVRGPVANIYGSGAIGGVVSFKTKDVDDVLRPGEKWGVLSRGLVSSNNPQYLGSTFFAARPSENVDIIFGGAYRNQSDYKDGHGDSVLNTGNRVFSGLAKVTFRPADGHEIKLGMNSYNGKFDSGQINSGIFGNDVQNLNFNGKYHFARPDTPLVDFTLSGYWTRTKVEQVVKRAFNAIVDPTLPSDDPNNGIPCATPGVGYCESFTGAVGTTRDFQIVTKGFDVHNTSRFNTGELRHTVTYGGDFFTDNVTVNAVDQGSSLTPGGKRDVGGAFVQWKTNYSTWLEVIGAARYDSYKLTQLDGSSASEGSRLSPKITVGITPFAGFTPYVTYAEGYRAPSVTETLIDGPHPGDILYFVPNPNLRPEIGKNLEFGLNLKYDDVFRAGDKFRAKFNVYRNNVKDYIDLETIVDFTPPLACPPSTIFGGFGAMCSQYVNITRARLDGVELAANYDAGKWFVGVNGSAIDGRDLDTGQRLRTVPPYRLAGTYGMRFFENRLTTAVRWQHLWDLPENPVTGSPQKAYDLIGLTFAYKPNEDTTWALVVDNLLNKYYVPYLQDLPAPGISVKGSLTIRFGSGSNYLASNR